MEKVKLFCLPYAGGSSTFYFKWKKMLGEYIEVYPVELAGRGRRCEDPLYETLLESVEDVYNSIAGHLEDGPYAIYGHSMGSWIAYELYYKIINMGRKKPLHVFFSGNEAPHVKDKDKKIHLLPDEEFQEEVLGLGGTPKAVFEEKSLSSVFLPIIRADYKIIENYEFEEKRCKIDCGVTVLNGNFDTFTGWKVNKWQDLCAEECKFAYFQGGHFFVNELTEEVTACVKDTLQGRIEGKV